MLVVATWALRGVTVIGGLLGGAHLFNSAATASQKMALAGGALALGYLVVKGGK